MHRSTLIILTLTALLDVGLSDLSVCQDIDTAACHSLAQQDPDICKKVAVAEVACPRFCNLCYKTCYLCENVVRHAQDCNQTAACGRGEKCFLRTLTSSTDGHVEYTMGCSTIERCDGIDASSIVGKRDVSFHCCTDDLCNDPFGRHTTVPTTVMPVQTSTQTLAASCTRDVLFMMSLSTSITRAESHTVSDFMGQVIQHFDIGRHSTLFALATYNTDVHERWDYEEYHSKSDLLTAVAQTKNFHSVGDHIDYDDVIKYITHHKADGDRSNVPTRAVIFVDHKDISEYHSTVSDYPQFGNDVIVVAIGTTEDSEAFSHLVPDPAHILHIAGYSDLNSIESNLVSLICS